MEKIRKKFFRRFMALFLTVSILWPILSVPAWGGSGNGVGDIAKEFLIQKISLPGVSYNSFGTVNAENLYHLGLEGSNGEKITVFCLDAPKNFGTGSVVRCIGSLDENGDKYTAREREKLKGLMYFYKNNRVFKNRALIQMLTQLGVWYVRTHSDNPDFNNAVFKKDVESILKDPNVCYNTDQAVRWYKEMTGIALEVGQYSSAYQLIAELFIKELETAVEAGRNIITYLWSTGKSLYQNLITTETVQRWEDRGAIEVYKRDEKGNALAGAVFTATESSSGEKYTIGPTDSQGYAVLDNIPSGIYTVVETGFPSGFMSSGINSWTVTVEFEQVSRIGGTDAVITNVPALGQVKLLKQNENREPLAGVQFGIYRDAACLISEQIGITGTDGTVTFTDLMGGQTYYVKEIAPANDHYIPDAAVYPITVTAGSTVWIKDGQAVINSLKKGSVGILKKDDRGRCLSGVVFGIYSEPGCLTEIGRVTTDSKGEGILDNLDCTKTVYVKEIETKDNTYVPDPAVYEATITADTVTWINKGEAVVNEQKRWQLKVYKRDSENKTLTAGDATVSGAVYGLYNASDELLDQYTTDDKGCFTTRPFTAATGYYLKEIQSAVGYRIDSQKHNLDKYTDPNLLTVPLTPAELVLPESVQTGTVSIIKWAEEENKQIPEEGAAFVIYLKSAGSYEAAAATGDSRIYDSAVVNAAGIAVWSEGEMTTRELAYGTYVIQQTVSTDGHRPIEDVEVEIKEDGRQYSYGFENPLYKTTVIVHKRDAESGERIVKTPAVFRIKNLDTGEYVSYTMTYPINKIITEFSTTDGTFTLPVALPFGRYAIEEIHPPEDYYPLQEAVEFTVNDETPPISIINIYNEPLKGRVELEKVGKVFAEIQKQDSDFGVLFQPVFQEGYLSDCSFDIIAREDIAAGTGEIRFKKGERVERMVTRRDGPVLSGELYRGEYELVEAEAPAGYTLNPEPIAFSVSNDGTQRVELQHIRVINERAPIQITLKKNVLEWEAREEKGYLTRQLKERPGEGFIFGLYTAERITTADGRESLTEDALVSLLKTNAEGDAILTTELPLGEYYVKELQAPENRYILSAEKYNVDLNGLDCVDPMIRVSVNEGKPIRNEFEHWPVKIKKIDALSARPLAGALIEIWDQEENLLYRSETGQDGTLEGVLLEPGVYTVREAEAPNGYAIHTAPFSFSVDKGEGVEGCIEIQNEPARLKIRKINEKGEVLAGVEFILLDPNGTEVFSGVTDADGEVEFIGIQWGEYRLREITAPDGYQKIEKDIPVEVTAVWDNEDDDANLIIINREAVNTGDFHNRIVWETMAGISLGACLLFVLLQKNKKNIKGK